MQRIDVRDLPPHELVVQLLSHRDDSVSHALDFDEPIWGISDFHFTLESNSPFAVKLLIAQDGADESRTAA